MQAFGIRYSPDPWHQAAQHGTSLLRASVASSLQIPPLLSLSSGSQPTISEGMQISAPAPGDGFGTGKSQVTQKDWSSVRYFTKLSEIWSVTLLVLRSEVVKSI